MKVSNKLQKLINTRNLTYEQLSRDTSISIDDIKKILNDNIITNKNKDIISNYFGLDSSYFDEEQTITKKDITNYIILVLSGLLFIACVIWAGIRPFNFGPYYLSSAWYIPFYWINADILIFQVFNILAILGIIYSILRLNNIKLRKKMKKNVK